jgi:hypothetical protein
VALTFGANSSVGPLDYGVVVRDKNTWLQLYTVPPAKVFGGLVFSLPNNVTLPNGGAFLELVTGTGTVVSSVEYNDVGRWPTIADGGGPSLELRCPFGDTRDPDNWIASPVAKNSDCYQETTGTPGLANTVVVCPARKFIKPEVYITEIFYNPVGGQGFRDATEFFEIWNAGPVPVNIGNWRFVTEGGLLRFTVAETNRSLTPGQVAVFVGDLAGFNTKWASVVPASAMVVSAFEGELANGGDKLVMMDDNGFEVDAVVYNDKFPWPLVADGLGADNTYIELVGDPLPQADWSGQTFRNMSDGGGFSLQRRSLTVGAPGDHVVRWTAALAAPGTLPANLGSAANNETTYIPIVSKRTAFPTGQTIDTMLLENQNATVEIDFLPKPSDLKSPLAYTSVRVAYVIDDPIFGDIVTGGNGTTPPNTTMTGSAVTLDATSFTIIRDCQIDMTVYMMATTANMGRAELTFTGTSGLYRVALWIVAENDGQSTYSVFFDGTLVKTLVGPLGDMGITADPKYITEFSASMMLTNGRKFAVESNQASGARGRWRGVVITPLTAATPSPSGAGDGLTRVTCTAVPLVEARFRCSLPPQPAQTIVRYRIEYVMSNAATVHISPRASDPMRYHAYFHTPTPTTNQPSSYFLYIRPDRWAYLQTTAEATRCSGCEFNPLWGAEVPAVLVYEGEVADITARFQGSRYNRKNGVTLDAASYPNSPPTGNFRATSWRWNMPPYHSQYGGEAIVLQKMLQGCTMYQTSLGYELYKAAGSEVSDWRFVRTYVNKKYFRYMIHVSHGEGEFIESVNEKLNNRCINRPRETVGALFKAQGFAGDECAYGPGSFQQLSDSCGFTAIQRYKASMGRKTNRFVDPQQSHGAMKSVIDQIAAFQVASPDLVACRAFLDSTFDVDRVLTSIAIQNFGQAWDDNFHNWFPYQRNTDGKWSTFPWDQDRMYGEAQGWATTSSIYIGDNNDADTRNKPYNNRIKHIFITCHKAALNQKYLLLLNTVLKNSTLQAIMDVVAKGPLSFNRTEATLQHGSFAQDTSSCETSLRTFFGDRPNQVLARLPVGLTAERTALTPDDFCFNTPKLTNPRPANQYVSLPGRPWRLVTTSVTDTEVRLSWLQPHPNGNVLETYSVERATGNGAFGAVGTVPFSSTVTPVLIDSGRAASTTYRYRVRVLGRVGMTTRFSAFSSVLTVTTPPAAPASQAPVVINEVRANSGTSSDFVELFNPLSIEADISGWRVIDDRDAFDNFVQEGVPLPAKVGVYMIPLGTKLGAGAFRVLDEATLGFKVSGNGGDIFLVRALPQASPFVPTGYIHGFRYGGSKVGTTMGRVVLSTGSDDLVPLKSATINTTNAEPAIGPIVIAEVSYKRTNSITQYIVLQNIGTASVPLFEGNSTWGLSGVSDYRLPSGITLAAGAKLYIANVDAASLRTELGLAATVAVAATPFVGSLSQSGERVALLAPSVDTVPMPPQVVMAEVEWLDYQTGAPWPAAGLGNASLVRLAAGAKSAAFALAQDPANWGVAVPTCATTCKNGGVCVRTNTCDCTGTNWDGAACDSAPLSCGDSTVQAPAEQCDGGACCTATCQFKTMGVECRAASGLCDVAETCAGNSGDCPADAFAATGFQCRAKNGACDVEETCSGTSSACPADAFAVSSVVCRAAVSQCDKVEFCTGTNGSCPPDTKAPATQVCRPSAGTCDVQELCDGVLDACPNDAKQPSTLACRASAGPCDVVEYCTGTTNTCPANGFHNSTVVCRAATGQCDADSRCTNTSAACPPITYKPSTTPCRNASTTVVCDATEFCTGSNIDCPTDGALPVGTTCVLPVPDLCVSSSKCAGLGQCDGVRDLCECTSDTECNDGNPCTADACVTLVAPLTGRKCVYTPAQDAKVCRPSAGICDEPERCDGARTTCPPDVFNAGSVVCRNSTGICDVAENCDGTAATCPRDRFAGNETICRPATSACDAADRCDGGSPTCGPNLNQPFGVVCRAAVSSCDAAEVCDGIASTCPADGPVVDGTPCQDSDPCTLETVCRMGACSGPRSLCNCQTDADCDDRNDCTEDKCTGLECKYTFAEEKTPCNDQDACTIVDKCNAGGRCLGRSFCENGSKCVKPGPFCECTEGFTGLRCEQVLCRPPCQNGGVCNANNTCACPLNTMGEQCEVLPTLPPTKAPGGGGLRDIKVKTYDISSPEFWSQELGGGLYGWSVAVIFFAFILLCVLSLVAVGCLLKHFIVDPVDKQLSSDML